MYFFQSLKYKKCVFFHVILLFLNIDVFIILYDFIMISQIQTINATFLILFYFMYNNKIFCCYIHGMFIKDKCKDNKKQKFIVK